MEPFTISAVAERFMRYVRIDTQSDPASSTIPSTEKQKTLSALLVTELKEMGITDAELDASGYVYATIPANQPGNIPVLAFCSHVDTAPDCSGTGVKPILHRNYQGKDIVLPDDTTQVLNITTHPYLQAHIGKDIITASGLTLLGADDKAGVAIIMQMAANLQEHPLIPHGKIRLLFTPDEEVGRGADHVDLEKLGADFGYTLDGGEAGNYEDETFSADGLILTVYGVIAHPGYAKGKLVNALKIAGEILAALPKSEWSPETTDGRQGFIHPVHMDGLAEKAAIEFIIRDFETGKLTEYANRLTELAREIVARYPGARMEVTVKSQYRNMRKILEQYPFIAKNTIEAYRRAGITIKKEPIRGGTDGSRLSFMGLPSPNLFTGMQAIHSRQEWVGVADMELAVKMLTELVQVWAEHPES